MVQALQLARGGWWGGRPGDILAAPADEVMMALWYDDFIAKFESASIELARKGAE